MTVGLRLCILAFAVVAISAHNYGHHPSGSFRQAVPAPIRSLEPHRAIIEGNMGMGGMGMDMGGYGGMGQGGYGGMGQGGYGGMGQGGYGGMGMTMNGYPSRNIYPEENYFIRDLKFHTMIIPYIPFHPRSNRKVPAIQPGWYAVDPIALGVPPPTFEDIPNLVYEGYYYGCPLEVDLRNQYYYWITNEQFTRHCRYFWY